MSAPRPRRWPAVLGVLAVALAGGYWWLFLEVPEPAGTWTVDLAEVRRLARSLEGDRPTEVRVERVQRFSFPEAVIRAGGSWSTRPMEVFSYQLVFPTHSAVVDTALAETLPLGQQDEAAFRRVGQALARADLIVVTHEHGDHLGGLVAQPNLKALLPAVRLTPEQVSHPELLEPARFPPGVLEGYRPLAYQGALAVAPGVVLLRAPGHTPGSQLVYVERADGAEYLFLGDVAWNAVNVTGAVERPRAIALALGEDRPPVVRQLQVLQRLATAEPGLHQVPGHDPAAVDALVARHLLVERFAVE